MQSNMIPSWTNCAAASSMDMFLTVSRPETPFLECEYTLQWTSDIQWNLSIATTSGPQKKVVWIGRWSLYRGQNQLFKYCWDTNMWSLERGGLWIQVVFKAGFTIIGTQVLSFVEVAPFRRLFGIEYYTRVLLVCLLLGGLYLFWSSLYQRFHCVVSAWLYSRIAIR